MNKPRKADIERMDHVVRNISLGEMGWGEDGVKEQNEGSFMDDLNINLIGADENEESRRRLFEGEGSIKRLNKYKDIT
jgi:hypothetical protein